MLDVQLSDAADIAQSGLQKVTQQKFVIVGGGIAGLMISRMIRSQRSKDAEIIVVERESHFGGQYSCVDYGQEGGRFDHGMHVYYDSCIPEVDQLFTSILPTDSWNIYEQNLKDVAGIFFNDTLQTHTPWVDLRKWPQEQLQGVLGGLWTAISQREESTDPLESAYSWLVRHYGKPLTDLVYVPILEKLYYHHPSELSTQVIKLSAMNRVVLFDEPLMHDLMKSDALRTRLGFPNQFTLPPIRTNGQRALYPKAFGFFRVMDRLRSVVEEEGSLLLADTVVESLAKKQGRIESIRLRSKSGEVREVDGITQVFWTSGLPPLAKSLGIDFSDLAVDMRPPGWYVHFRLDQPPAMDRLYYFYSFQPGTRTFRVTNYAAYCPAATADQGYPLCVELWANPGDSVSVSDAIEQATQELQRFGVIAGKTGIRYCNAERVAAGGGVPLPTLKNAKALSTLRRRIQDLGMANLRTAGVLAEPDVFFVPEVLRDAWNKVRN